MTNRLDKSNPILWFVVLGAALIFFIAIVAIIDRVSNSSDTAQVATVKVAASNPVSTIKTGNKIGDVAPDFTLETIDGKAIKLSDYRGKNIILNFWATWCGPCRYEMPSLQSAHDTWQKADVIVLAVCVQDSVSNARNYAKANGLTFTIPMDISGHVAESFAARGLPTSFFIDSDGVIKSIKIGPFINIDEIEQRMVSFK